MDHYDRDVPYDMFFRCSFISLSLDHYWVLLYPSSNFQIYAEPWCCFDKQFEVVEIDPKRQKESISHQEKNVSFEEKDGSFQAKGISTQGFRKDQ